MKRGKATHRWRFLILLLLLALAVAGGSWHHFSVTSKARAIPKKALVSSHQKTAPAPVAALPPADVSLANDTTKVRRAKVSARIRVRPGEAAVMGYYEIAPGKLGLTIVTPEARENGQVSVQLRTLELADSEAMRSRAEELLPHIFELEKTGVISQARMAELLRSLTKEEDVKTVGYPSITTHSGQGCNISTGVDHPGGEFLGITYAIKADSIPGADGYDLSVDFEHSGRVGEE